MILFELDEKEKFSIKSLTIFLIGLFSIFFINHITTKSINKAYLNQNIAIVGALGENKFIELNEIIPIITKGDLSYLNKGKEILDKYSYNEILPINKNIILNKTFKNFYLITIATYLIIFLFIFTYMKRQNKILETYINNLTKKAEYIVEGKDLEIKNENYKIKSFENLDNQFNLMKSRIDRSIKDLKDEKINLKNIVNDICHQFKTPLAAMSIYNDILKKQHKMKGEDIDYFIAMTEEQLERMDWLTKTLLKYARLEGNVVEYKMKKQSLNITLENSIEALKLKASEKSIEVKFEQNDEIELLHDRKWIEEAIINIIKNAIEHSNEKDKIIVRAIESEVFVRVEIEDRGEGISEKDINKIFTRFHKGSNSINPRSIGIGLSLSKSIIEANLGEIKVKSKLGEGSNFIITFIKQ